MLQVTQQPISHQPSSYILLSRLQYLLVIFFSSHKVCFLIYLLNSCLVVSMVTITSFNTDNCILRN